VLARVLQRRKAALVGLIVLGLIGAVALLAPWLAPYDPIKVDQAAALSRPGVAHPLGTDQYGRDILSRVLVGARLSLLTGLGAVAIALGAGMVLGLVSGVLGGWTDLLFMRLVDIMLAIPFPTPLGEDSATWATPAVSPM
jgi:peptide/nickel transport system permease protein